MENKKKVKKYARYIYETLQDNPDLLEDIGAEFLRNTYKYGIHNTEKIWKKTYKYVKQMDGNIDNIIYNSIRF